MEELPQFDDDAALLAPFDLSLEFNYGMRLKQQLYFGETTCHNIRKRNGVT